MSTKALSAILLVLGLASGLHLRGGEVATADATDASSFLEMGTTWTGWAPKMKSSFDVETHAWKPPWFQDGVRGVYVEPFPSYIWLKNGVAVPLMHADKYFFQKESLEDGEEEEIDDNAPVEQARDENDKTKKKKDEDDGPMPMVDGVPVPVAKEQYKKMDEFGISKMKYVPGSLVGQKIFNDWWKTIHQREDGPSPVHDAADEIRSWFLPHTKGHFKKVKNNWINYFKKSLGLWAEDGEGPKEEDATGPIPPSPSPLPNMQNDEELRAGRKKFFFKPFPAGECVNIGSGVYCAPMIRDRQPPKPLDIPDPASAARIHNTIAAAGQQRGSGQLGLLVSDREKAVEEALTEEGQILQSQLPKGPSR